MNRQGNNTSHSGREQHHRRDGIVEPVMEKKSPLSCDGGRVTIKRHISIV